MMNGWEKSSEDRLNELLIQAKELHGRLVKLPVNSPKRQYLINQIEHIKSIAKTIQDNQEKKFPSDSYWLNNS